MAQSIDLEDAQVVLLATQFVTQSDLTQLQLLAAEQKQVLVPSLLYRLLLTYLPTNAENVDSLAQFLKHLTTGFRDVSDLDASLDQSGIQGVPTGELKKTLHNLRLDSQEQTQESAYDDELSVFLVQWLHKVEHLSGIPASTAQILEPLLESRPKLRSWLDSFLVPLMRLQTEFYPGRAEFLNTELMESLHGVSGVKSLLQFAEQDADKANIGRDLDAVITPWVRGAGKTKRRRLSQPDLIQSDACWQDVNEWIYATSRNNFTLAAKSFLHWNGPTDEAQGSDGADVRYGTAPMISYIQTGLALICTSTIMGRDANLLLRQLLHRAASISATVVDVASDASRTTLSDASKSDLFENTILRPNNPITCPSNEVFNFLDNCLSAQHLLEGFKISLPLAALVDTALFGSEERQKQELLRILQQIPRLTRTEPNWPLVRQQLHLLRVGENTTTTQASKHPGTVPYTFLGRVSSTHLEGEFLDILITNAQYSTVKDIYLDTMDVPLQKDVVREHIISAIYAAYDNASNGNRTRGGMKRAYDIFQAFQSLFTHDSVFTSIDHLIRATHSLSFYQLTLQHGVPFQPATIRIHHDPLSLIEKVLAQNHKAFTKLDDLIEIGRNLIQANLPDATDPSDATTSLEERLFDAQHRITYLAITSALSDHDFDTAYSYITTRLATSPAQTSHSPFTDDTSWRAAYAAGKYRPSSSPKNLHDRITGLSKRMDLLSLALTLTPTPESLSEILATWRRCEEEMDSLKSQAVREERAVDIRPYGNSTLPGGFAEDREVDTAETRRMMERRALGGSSGPSYEEEAPMGLFDVARGAASAFRKSAFPLRGATGQVNARHQLDNDTGSDRESFDEQRQSGDYQRVRKRDMVSNMVTGGLVSGMSWVLGAPSSRQNDEK